ncbi:MAG: 23S rRNA (pseudouridine(1915)-N(3))-methyltransferase RlmH [bacterium]|nr:23S rRNA (pseudouridine(1915)-N(3))-methyltransferase RlmH [bacterium]
MRLLLVGKTKESYLLEGCQIYLKRLVNYSKVELVFLKESNQTDPKAAKAEEAGRIMDKLDPQALCILLDERGQSFSSEGLAAYLEKQALAGFGKIDWVVGGAWGAGDALKARADLSLSLSKLTLTHQMVRLFLLEQIYRALTILKGEKYHNP